MLTKIETYGNWGVKIIAVILSFALMASYQSNREQRQKVERMERDKLESAVFEKYCDKQEAVKTRQDLDNKVIMETLSEIKQDLREVKTELKLMNK
jgi:C4-dicarboxylate-specific signal transduction histidine kinase